jgi:hypothetical protein
VSLLMLPSVKMSKILGKVLTNSSSAVVDHVPVHPKVEGLSPAIADGIRCENGKSFGKILTNIGSSSTS